MNINKPKRSFEIIYHDEHLIEVKVEATNGRYAGTTIFYSDANGEELIELGEKLRGFPNEIGQVIEQEFGYTKKEHIAIQKITLGMDTELTYIPYVHLKFLCIDNIGHTAVDIFLVEDNWTVREEVSRLSIML